MRIHNISNVSYNNTRPHLRTVISAEPRFLTITIIIIVLSFIFALTVLFFKIDVSRIQLQPVINEWTARIGSYIFGLLDYYEAYIPLGIIGIWRWATWIAKKAFAVFYAPIDDEGIRSATNNLNFGIITPVYKENPNIFYNALRSWEKNRPYELIAVIDSADEDCINVFRQFAEGKSWTKLITTLKPGKRAALADGIISSKSSILALVDSDSIWAPNIRDKLLAPFISDTRIGGVTTKQHPINRNTIWEKMTDIFWDFRNYYDLPSQAAMGRALSCLSGRTSLYRRKIIVEKLDLFLNEILFGVRKESGEDKCLTRLIQQDGWQVYYQSNATIYSAAANDFRTFWNQRVRWSRNSHNSDLISLWNGWAWKHPFLAFYMIDRLISIFTIFIGPIYLAISIYQSQWIITISIICLWFVGRGMKIAPHIRHQPKDLFLLPIFIAANFLVGLAKLYALVTIKDQKWIRTSKERSGSTKQFLKRAKDIAITTGILGIIAISVIFFSES